MGKVAATKITLSSGQETFIGKSEETLNRARLKPTTVVAYSERTEKLAQSYLAARHTAPRLPKTHFFPFFFLSFRFPCDTRHEMFMVSLQ